MSAQRARREADRLLLLEQLEAERFGDPEDDLRPRPKPVPLHLEPVVLSPDEVALRRANERVAEERERRRAWDEGAEGRG